MADRAEYWRRAFEAHVKDARAILEIGSFIGASAELFLTLLPQARIVCVDPFTGDLHGGEAYNGDVATIEARFDAAMAPFPGRVEKIVSRSVPALDAMKAQGCRFDIIYIDGNHFHDDIILDSLLAWPVLKVGGLMMRADYRFGATWPRRERPGHAIETFLSLHPDHRVVRVPYQLAAVMTTTPRTLRARLAAARRALRK